MCIKRYGVKTKVWEEIIELAKQTQVEKVILFGSRARGDYKERSDIDLAILGGDSTLFTVEIEEKVSTLLMFDIVNLLESVQPELKKSIESEGILLYEKT